MSGFGDFDPEDAYDAGDPLEVRAELLGRVLSSIVAEQARDGDTPRLVARVRGLRRLLEAVLGELD